MCCVTMHSLLHYEINEKFSIGLLLTSDLFFDLILILNILFHFFETLKI